jgi:putative Ca2+/H+ antiporter (TMEM165/GDT1 family)
MTTFLVVFAIAFGAVLLVELPDKTLVATLVLSTKYRPRPVLAGVTLAFAVQCVIAVTAGGLLHLLPHRVLEAIVAVLFAAGAILLFRESRSSDEPVELDDPSGAEVGGVRPGQPALSGRRIFSISFGVLFAAEWGDASQLATAALTARYDAPVSVLIGAYAALVGVATLAIALGQEIVRLVPLVWIHRVAGALFAGLAVVVAVQAVRG